MGGDARGGGWAAGVGLFRTQLHATKAHFECDSWAGGGGLGGLGPGGQAGASAAPCRTTPPRRNSQVSRGTGGARVGDAGVGVGCGAGGRICRTDLHNATTPHFERESLGGRGVGVGDPGEGGRRAHLPHRAAQRHLSALRT